MVGAHVTPAGAAHRAPHPLGATGVPHTGEPAAFAPLTPCRLFDSRDTGERIGNEAVIVPTSGHCAVPPGATALAVSITATRPVGAGFATVWPAGSERPLTSTVNYAHGETRTNGSIVTLGTDGSLALASSTPVDLVVDVTGVFVATADATAGRFVPAPPVRLLDTRETGSGIGAGHSVTIPLPAGVPADATAVAVSLATSDSLGPGFFTTHAAGTERPGISSLNTDGHGQVRATGQVVAVGDGGFTVFSQTGGHVVVDLTGWFTGPSAPRSSSGLFVAIDPARLADTRAGTPVFPGGTLRLDPAALAGRPVAAVAANLTMTGTWRGGFLTVHPAGSPRPLAASANADRRNQDVAQFALLGASGNGIDVFASSGTDVVVDVTGWFTGEPPPAGDAAAVNAPAADLDRRVLLVGDSTLAGLRWYANSRQALAGSSFALDAESCRRLVGRSCHGREGRQPSNVIEALAAAQGPVEVVVVMAGYNDWYSTFPTAFDEVVAAARATGAERIVWLTYRERSTYRNPVGGVPQAESFRIQNQVLRAKVASGAFGDVTLLDWNAATEDRDEWFTSDGVHLTLAGAYGAADMIARAVSSLDREPCHAPSERGGSAPAPCPWPDRGPGVTDPIGLYAGNPNDVHCYEVGADRHVECRVDPKLSH